MRYSVEMERGVDGKETGRCWVVNEAGGRVAGPFASLAEAEAWSEAEALKEIEAIRSSTDDSLSP